MLQIKNLSYQYSYNTPLFNSINLFLDNHEKIGLVGPNGSGKSTLLQLIAGNKESSNVHIKTTGSIYYLPQVHPNTVQHQTIGQALGIEKKLKALEEIAAGNVTEQVYETLGDDWLIEERAYQALEYWDLQHYNLHSHLAQLSGGEQTKVFLAYIQLHQPDLLLLDEPTNHLDAATRTKVYAMISAYKKSCIVVSHDKSLLKIMPAIVEISQQELKRYGGNYDLYEQQVKETMEAKEKQLNHKAKEIKIAQKTQTEALERKQKLDARGAKKKSEEGVAKIMMNTLKNKAEQSTAKLKDTHQEKIVQLKQELQELRKEQLSQALMQFKINIAEENSAYKYCSLNQVSFQYQLSKKLWQHSINLFIKAGERIALHGNNGVGKSTLIQLIMGALQPTDGIITNTFKSIGYIDQNYSVLQDTKSVLEQAQLFNSQKLDDAQLKSKLTHFLFHKEQWDQRCATLSGGEQLRLVLCCMLLDTRLPELLILDEPTNNLDIQNVSLLEEALNNYNGTLILLSHDAHFVASLHIDRHLVLNEEGLKER